MPANIGACKFGQTDDSGTVPASVFNSVDLPAPLRPSKATISFLAHIQRGAADVLLPQNVDAQEAEDLRRLRARWWLRLNLGHAAAGIDCYPVIGAHRARRACHQDFALLSQ
jgi:hypothetical protein